MDIGDEVDMAILPLLTLFGMLLETCKYHFMTSLLCRYVRRIGAKVLATKWGRPIYCQLNLVKIVGSLGGW